MVSDMMMEFSSLHSFFGQTFSFILCDCEVSNCINNERNGFFFCSYVLLEWPLLVYLVNVFLLLGPRPKSKQSGRANYKADEGEGRAAEARLSTMS